MYKKFIKTNKVLKNYNNKCDIWAFAMTAIHLLTTTPEKDSPYPANSKSYNKLKRKHEEDFAPEKIGETLHDTLKGLGLPKGKNEELIKMLTGALKTNYRRRSNIEDIINSPIIREYMPPGVAGSSCKEINFTKYSGYKTTKNMYKAIDLIFATYYGRLSTLTVRTMFFALDLYMRVAIAFIGGTEYQHRQIAYACIRLAFDFYEKNTRMLPSRCVDDSIVGLKKQMLILLKGKLRTNNYYDVCSDIGQLTGIYLCFADRSLKLFDKYFSIDREAFARVVGEANPLEGEKAITCKEFFKMVGKPSVS